MTCPHCGAPLAVTPPEAAVVCGYCQSVEERATERPPEKGLRYGSHSLEEWMTALSDARTETRAEAVRAVGALGARARPAVPALLPLLFDPGEVPEIAGAAAGALGNLGGEEAYQALLAKLADPVVGGWAAVGLGRLGDRRAVEPLRTLLRRRDWPHADDVLGALQALAPDCARRLRLQRALTFGCSPILSAIILLGLFTVLGALLLAALVLHNP